MSPNPSQKLLDQARGGRLLALLQRPFVALDRLMEIHLPPSLNPFAQTGALANVSFIIAAVTGVLLLFWYSPSVHEAWASLEDMGFLGQLMRSLHRYSSDATMVFVLFHALKLLLTARFGGPRWVAWVTGVFSLGTLWAVGWLGYWLVWDVRAQAVAVSTANFVEPLPIFTDPLTRTFLINDSISSGLFVTVFFFHMLIPLVIGVAIWMHISRVSRARFLTSKSMTAWLIGALVVASLIYPATSAAEADMALKPAAFTMDWWYLLPLMLTERLGTGSVWVFAFLLGLLLYSIPWSLTKTAPEKAKVDLNRCNGCMNCANDCPYGAITMVPRTDGRPYELEAKVDPNLCVGCTICSGSCNSAGVGLPSLPVQEKRKVVDTWVDQVHAEGEDPLIAFLCANSAAGEFEIDELGQAAEMPGFRCIQVPCSGWVNPITVERALRRGAKGVLVVGCGCSDPPFREGVAFTQARLEAKREPGLRLEKIDASRVRFILHPPGDLLGLLSHVEDYKKHTLSVSKTAFKVRPKHWLVGGFISVILGLVTLIPSDAPSLLPEDTAPEFVLSLKYRPDVSEDCRPATEAEKAKMMRHMQSETICERQRPAVRVEIFFDGEQVHDGTYRAHGLSSDGPSFAIVRLPARAEKHLVQVHVGHVGSPEWTHKFKHQVGFPARRVQVLDFDEGRWTPHFGQEN